MQECPVMIEHVPAIVGMRRSLVMMESNFPSLLQSAFTNMENNFAPWAFSQLERADWAKDRNVRLASDCTSFEYLFWVGCAGSYDERAKKISIAFSELLNIAGINYAILGTEEYCNGDLARRTGNEYLADMLIKMNIETLKKYKVTKILTICPHCYNTLKNDYPSYGVEFEVIHHTEFLNNLIKQGKLKITDKMTKKLNTVYHDSCYLGRYNNIYNEPRQILQSIPKINLFEIKRNKDKGFCCGAGGGQMFMEESKGKRVNLERTAELIKISPDLVALNCPFCMTMISDGLKAMDSEFVQVKDIAEILLESVVT
jgi:Fe-S oxidoreductase